MNINGRITNFTHIPNSPTSTRSDAVKVSRIMQSVETLATTLNLKSARTERKLLQAIKKNDASYLNQKLNKHPELAEKLIKPSGFAEKITPLGLACFHAQLEAILELIQAGVDINQTNAEGATALMFAVKSDSLTAVNLLLEKNPDVNQADCKGFSPLMMAITSGNFDIVKLLLEHNANFYQFNNRGIYCSTIATAYGKLEILKALIEHGLDVYNETDEYNNLLMVACKHGHLDIARFLREKGMNVDQQAIRTKTTALHYAVKYGHAEVVDFLIKAGANPNLTDIHGLTPLFFAKENRNSQITRILTACGAVGNRQSFVEGNLSRFSANKARRADIYSDI